MALPERLNRLFIAAEKPKRVVLGLMSGTSMDGLDLALCEISGHGEETRVELLHSRSVEYSTNDRTRMRALVSQDEISLKDACVFNAWLSERHGEEVEASLEQWGFPSFQVDCIASHGMTLYHAPASWNAQGSTRHATLQMGDGDHLAVRTGIITLSDFRQKEIAGGGEGAPLAPYVDALLFASENPRILLNLGGIANFTWLPPKGAGVLPVFGDTGPANALMDRAVVLCFPDNGMNYDDNGHIAKEGDINNDLLETFKSHPFFEKPMPKSTGTEVFGDEFVADAWERALASGISGHDFIATLTRLSADTIADAIKREIPNLSGTEIYGSGGGWKNPTLRRWLRDQLPQPKFMDATELGFPTEFKEAMIFAVLANETLCGEGFKVLMKGSEGKRFGFGKISLPD